MRLFNLCSYSDHTCHSIGKYASFKIVHVRIAIVMAHIEFLFSITYLSHTVLAEIRGISLGRLR